MKKFFMFIMVIFMMICLFSCKTTHKAVDNPTPLTLEEIEKKKIYTLTVKNDSSHLEVLFCIIPKMSMLGDTKLDKEKMCNVCLKPGESIEVNLPGFIHFALFALVVDTNNGNVLCHPQNGPIIWFKMMTNGLFIFNDKGMSWRKSV